MKDKWIITTVAFVVFILWIGGMLGIYNFLGSYLYWVLVLALVLFGIRMKMGK